MKKTNTPKLSSASKFNNIAPTLFFEKSLTQMVLNSISDGVIITDENGAVVSINPVATRITGWSTDEALGKDVLSIFKAAHLGTVFSTGEHISSVFSKKIAISSQQFTVAKHNTKFESTVLCDALPILGDNKIFAGVVLIFRDLTETKNLTAAISHQTTHDLLTGLINRQTFNNLVDSALRIFTQNKVDSSVLVLDLDQFKIVNDTCGHAAGDELLIQVTAILKKNIGAGITLARLAGDEFGILLEGFSTEASARMAENLRIEVHNYKFTWEGQTFSTGLSIGLISFSSGFHTLKQVLSAADSACYIAKEKGRNQVCVYEPAAPEQALRSSQMAWVVRIQKALEHNLFFLQAQSIVPVDSSSNNKAHYEMLIRMRAEDGSIIPPMTFIPAAERYNLMSTIDRWVVRRAFSFANTNLNAVCCINLSAQSLGDGKFLQFVKDELDDSGVNPENICFEITETTAIANFSQAIHFIQQLKTRGCCFALDDFGSGMSSFNYLKQLPVDFLKIDGGFVKNMATNPIDHAMVESINHIGHLMGLRTIAEFVEDDAILHKLKELGVDFAQGYGIGKPTELSFFSSQPSNILPLIRKVRA